jgi:small GTP-binding protein
VKLQIYDTAGQEMYRSIASAYFRKAAGCIAMFDVTNKQSFESLEQWARDVYSAAPNARILVVGNKKDLESGRRVKATAAMDFAGLIKADYTETSATDGKSVELMFDLLATRIYGEIIEPNGASASGAKCPEGITLSASIAEPKGPEPKCGCV